MSWGEPTFKDKDEKLESTKDAKKERSKRHSRVSHVPRGRELQSGGDHRVPGSSVGPHVPAPSSWEDGSGPGRDSTGARDENQVEEGRWVEGVTMWVSTDQCSHA